MSKAEPVLPPNDSDAERAALGSVLLDWKNSMPTCIEWIGSKRDIFYELRHQQIYGVMVEMYDANEAIDLVTLSAWLSFQSLLESVGGVFYLDTLIEATPSAANLTYYLNILTDMHKARRLIRICSEKVSDAYDRTQSTDDLIFAAATQMMALADDSITKNGEASMQELMPAALQQIESWHASQGVMSGIATGFSDLDKMTTGLHGNEMIVIAGRPSMGKTSLAMNIADHAAVELGLPVGVFSLEMTKEALAVRLLCSRARVNARNIQAGFLSHADMPKITTATNRLVSSNLFINDESGLNILGLRTRARRMAQKHGIKLLVIDYLQLMTAERRSSDSREQEVSFISKGVKALAKELDIPIIALSQLNRGLEKEKDRRPRMSDLRESGSLEQDADFVGILWKPYTEEREDDAVAVNLEVCKQRNGPTGTVPLTFLRHYTRFESAANVSNNGSAGYQAPYSDNEPQEQQQEFPS